MPGSDLPQGSQAIVRALNVLQAFTCDRAAMSVRELGAAAGLSLPTAHRIVKTLVQEDYLARDSAGRVVLGPKILFLASIMSVQHSETMIGTPALIRIRDLTGETVGLHRRMGDRRVCVAEEVARQPIRVISGVGQSYPLTAGASSKAIMSVLPDEEIDAVLNRYPGYQDRHCPLRRRFLAAIDETRNRGYAVSDSETIAGASAIAMPLPVTDHLAPAAINLKCPRDRMTPDLVAKGVEAMRLESQAFAAGLTRAAAASPLPPAIDIARHRPPAGATRKPRRRSASGL